MNNRIVVIDDNPIVLELVSLFLEEEGYQVAVAPDGDDGLETIRTHRPGVVICDVNMPGLNGIEVLRSIRRMALSSSPAFIVITADHAQETIALAAGADVCLLKPFEPEDLVESVRTHAALALDAGPAA